jgi:hypothetical protein
MSNTRMRSGPLPIVYSRVARNSARRLRKSAGSCASISGLTSPSSSMSRRCVRSLSRKAVSFMVNSAGRSTTANPSAARTMLPHVWSGMGLARAHQLAGVDHVNGSTGIGIALLDKQCDAVDVRGLKPDRPQSAGRGCQVRRPQQDIHIHCVAYRRSIHAGHPYRDGMTTHHRVGHLRAIQCLGRTQQSLANILDCHQSAFQRQGFHIPIG